MPIILDPIQDLQSSSFFVNSDGDQVKMFARDTYNLYVHYNKTEKSETCLKKIRGKQLCYIY